MRSNIRTIALPGALTAAVLLSACANMPGMSGTKSEAPATAAPATAPAAKTGPGMNERGEVVDVKKVEAGYGQKVKGVGDWEGEITGKPAPGSKFTPLKIGMSAKQVTDIVGQPTDQGAYVTGKRSSVLLWLRQAPLGDGVQGPGPTDLRRLVGLRLQFAPDLDHSRRQRHRLSVTHPRNEAWARARAWPKIDDQRVGQRRQNRC